MLYQKRLLANNIYNQMTKYVGISNKKLNLIKPNYCMVTIRSYILFSFGKNIDFSKEKSQYACVRIYNTENLTI